MQSGDIITIQFADEEKRPDELGMVEITTSFFLKHRFRYAFGFGPTDQQGRMRVSYDDIEEQRPASLKVQPWDYKTTTSECDSRITISTRTQVELEKAIECATLFNRGTTPAGVRWWTTANNARIRCTPIDVSLVRREHNLLALLFSLNRVV
jgi:hypothetical protein